MNGRLHDEDLAAVLKRVVQSASEPPTGQQRRTMWSKVAAAREEERIYGSGAAQHPLSIVHVRAIRGRPMWWMASAAATLLVAGVVIGIAIRPAVVKNAPVVATATTRANMAQITADHFAASQRLLMTVAAQSDGSRSSTTDAALVGRARALLSTTQILLDSPAGVDPGKRQLLSDLELVLVQIVQLTPEPLPGDRELVARAIAGRRMIRRLQSAVPAGATWGT